VTTRASRVACVLALALLPFTSSRGESIYVTPDVPSVLGGAMHQPNEVVRNDAGSYTVPFSVPVGLAIDALHRTESGAWLFSFDGTAMLGGMTFQREDVVRYSSSTGYTLFFDGSAYLGPNGSDVDAVFLDASGDPVLSFDVPTSIGGTTYDPADLVGFDASGFSLVFDGSAAGLPISSNVTGADRRDTRTIVTLDVPTGLGGGGTALPGDLAAWNGTFMVSFYRDLLWPPTSRANALAFLADPGEVSNITLSKSPIAPGVIEISWTASCSAGAEDYGIYEGQLGNWTSHAQIDCSDDGGDFSEQITPGTGNHYYLVAAHNPNDEGSCGRDSNGLERPPGTPACVTPQAIGSCP